jgi:hypothetical protein
MGFTAGENLEFRFWAQMIDFGLGDQIVREDDVGLYSTLVLTGMQ